MNYVLLTLLATDVEIKLEKIKRKIKDSQIDDKDKKVIVKELIKNLEEFMIDEL